MNYDKYISLIEVVNKALLIIIVACEYLTHWGRVTHIHISKLIIIATDNGLSPGRRQAIIWTNSRILLIGPLETNFSEILIEIDTFSLKKMRYRYCNIIFIFVDCIKENELPVL